MEVRLLWEEEGGKCGSVSSLLWEKVDGRVPSSKNGSESTLKGGNESTVGGGKVLRQMPAGGINSANFACNSFFTVYCQVMSIYALNKLM